MKYLLDTCVISEIVKKAPSETVLAWINDQDEDDLYLSVITIGEIRKGIEAARAKAPEAAAKYEHWLDGLVADYGDRILPLDQPGAQIWGRLMARLPGSGVEDAQIAAIALSRDMTVVTRNVAHFAPFQGHLLNPF